MHNSRGSRGLLSKAVSACFRLWPAWCAAAFLFGGLCASARPSAGRATLSPFEHAEHLHAALEEQPQQQRTRGDYERVLDAYRFIYHSNPASSKADASISAVAGLLAEEGRLFHSGKALHDAVAQYEFLRREYPTSRYRFSALLAQGEIYRTDLSDPDQAKTIFQEFVKTYPRNPLAGQARIELQEIREGQRSEKRPDRDEVQDSSFAEIQPATAPDAARPFAAPVPKTTGDTGARASLKSNSERPATMPSAPSQVSSAAPPAPQPPIHSEGEWGETSLPAPVVMNSGLDSDSDSLSSNRGRRPRVTAIRDWSTSDSTRIAIDLDAQVQYQAARVSHPERIYFDLRDAHLAHDLAGKSILVTDGGFLKRIRAAQYSDEVTRIVLDVNAGTDYSAFFLPNPWRLIIDIHGRNRSAPSANEVVSLGGAASSNSAPSNSRPVTSVAGKPPQATLPNPLANEGSENELDTLVAPAPGSISGSSRNTQLERQVHRAKTVNLQPAAGSIAAAASPNDLAASAPDLQPEDETLADPAVAAGVGKTRSLARTLGLKIGRIVIDAGHGGHDSGTLGPGGIEEKDITLDVALRLGRLLKQRLGEDVIYTRTRDTFIPLETRTAIANRSHADLFISVHANSSSDPSARGVESYYLNFTTSPEALEVAARENAASDESIYELSDLVKKITLRDKIEESREFAEDVQQSLYNGLATGNPGLRDRGVKKAPFVVLIGANMPSILAEISFLTNPEDARELRQSAYRERIAESLYRGVAIYINGLNGVRLAQNGARPGN